jgi:hypothetical protein
LALACVGLVACDGSAPGGGAQLPQGPSTSGKVFGVWEGVDENAPGYVTFPGSDPCLGLEVAFVDGAFEAHSLTPWPGRREAALALRDWDHSFLMRVSERGPAKHVFAAECFAKFDPKPTCAQLGPAFRGYLVALNIAHGVDCITQEPGGCDCTFDMDDARGYLGSWSPATGEITFAEPSVAGEKAAVRIEDGILRLYPDPEWAHPGLSRIPFERGRCDDGKKGFWEEGIDCGGACGNTCN